MMLESVCGAIVAVVKVGCIIFPLTIGYQLLRDNRWLAARSGWLRGRLSGLGLGDGAAVPLLAGVVLGITYGAGVLIPEARKGKMSEGELLALSFFLCTCHAVIEDTLLFVVIGGDGFWILAPRLVLAMLLTAIIAKWGQRRATRADQSGHS